jgi:hypothetical protein
MGKRRAGYLAYMLRLWQTRQETGISPVESTVTWRASVENPHTGERRGFLSLEALFDYLSEQAGAASDLNEKGQWERE